MTKLPILGYTHLTQPFSLHTDASQDGLRAVLYQRQNDKMVVIGYGSRTLTFSQFLSLVRQVTNGLLNCQTLTFLLSTEQAGTVQLQMAIPHATLYRGSEGRDEKCIYLGSDEVERYSIILGNVSLHKCI